MVDVPIEVNKDTVKKLKSLMNDLCFRNFDEAVDFLVNYYKKHYPKGDGK